MSYFPDEKTMENLVLPDEVVQKVMSEENDKSRVRHRLIDIEHIKGKDVRELEPITSHIFHRWRRLEQLELDMKDPLFLFYNRGYNV